MSDTTPDVRYADLLDEAIARIPALAPEWTDHNPSDPGIALLELSAWLVETVLYRTTRITDDGRQALLGLLRGADPDPTLRGDVLAEAMRDAIKALRRPYRAITAQDFHDRLRDDWPTSTGATALGLSGQLAGVSVFANTNLEAADPYAHDPVHQSVVVTPGSLGWRHAGSLDPTRPSLFVQQLWPDALTVDFPLGASRVRVSGAGSVLRDEALAIGAGFTLTPTATQLGDSGELVIEADAAALASGLNLTTARVADRRLTAPDNVLLGARFIPVRRAGHLQVIVTTESTALLRLELRYFNNQVAASAEGTGVVCLSHAIAASSVASPHREWQLRLFAPEATAAVEVDWRVWHHQEPLRYAAGGDALLDAVWDFLDARRLLTVRHHVTAPRWVFLGVTAHVFLADGTDRETALPRLYDALYARFPLPGKGSRPLGEPVFLTEVIAALEAIEGIDYIEDLVITLHGASVGAVSRVLLDDGEPYGLTLMPDEAVTPRCDLITFTLYERS